jgi:protein tyrosine/serine phosphatase
MKEMTMNFIDKYHIRTIFNVAKECDDTVIEDIDMFKYDIEDTFHSIYVLIIDVVEEIKKQIHKGAVLVHCRIGVSRSATMVIAYLMYVYNWTLCKAIMYVKDRRPEIKPNPMFVKDLMKYEYELFRTDSFQFAYDEYSIDYILCYTNVRMSNIKLVRQKYYETNKNIEKTIRIILTGITF